MKLASYQYLKRVYQLCRKKEAINKATNALGRMQITLICPSSRFCKEYQISLNPVIRVCCVSEDVFVKQCK